jgi:hypothetical protein
VETAALRFPRDSSRGKSFIRRASVVCSKKLDVNAVSRIWRPPAGVEFVPFADATFFIVAPIACATHLRTLIDLGVT